AQAPAPSRWTFAPLIVQSPLTANVTARPELAVAATRKSGSPNCFGGNGSNEIVCGVLKSADAPCASAIICACSAAVSVPHGLVAGATGSPGGATAGNCVGANSTASAWR